LGHPRSDQKFIPNLGVLGRPLNMLIILLKVEFELYIHFARNQSTIVELIEKVKSIIEVDLYLALLHHNIDTLII
jgi:hypothetical protein